MAIVTETISNAQAGQDLLINSVHRTSAIDRVISGAQCYVSASGDEGHRVQIYVADVLLGEIFAVNSATVLSGYALYPVDGYVPGGSEIRAINLETAGAAANTISIIVEIDETDEDDDLDALVGAAM